MVEENNNINKEKNLNGVLDPSKFIYDEMTWREIT